MKRMLLLVPWFISLAVPALAQAHTEPAPAQRYQWKNVALGAGGFAPNIIFSRAEKDLAYLRTDMGGAYRWDGKRQRWMPLQDSNAVSSYMGIESIATDPKDPGVVYLAAGMNHRGEAAIWRSADRGEHWSVIPVPFKMGGNENGRGLGERLAIDPNRTSTLLFGSRHDGLQRSDDRGMSWRKVESFPHKGLGPPAPRQTHAGLSFVIFDDRSGQSGKGSQIVYVGVADPGQHHLYRSVNGGESWAPVTGGPGPEMLPVRADMASSGELYIAYSTDIGPNGVRDGSIWKLNTQSDRWTEITPDRSAAREGGYMGVSVDRQRPGRVAVSTINRWKAGDTVWITNNGGRDWQSMKEHSRRDVSRSPFLRWGRDEAEFGHWTAGLGIDPFDSDVVAYTTGATVYRTEEGSRRGSMLWKPWVQGVEQTAVITLVSPTGGAPLISGFGDLAGFVHDRLDVSPPVMHLNPRLTNTNNLDYAGLSPQIVVRSGSLHAEQPQPGTSTAWSVDGGRTWQPLRVPPIRVGGATPQRYDLTGEAPITVSADGRTFMVATPIVMATKDRGQNWYAPAGLPPGVRPVADKADASLYYAIDFNGGKVFVSRDGGISFAPALAQGLPHDLSPARPRNRESQPAMQAAVGQAGELWFLLSGALWRSADAGASFRRMSREDMTIELFGLGKAAPGNATPSLYAIGTQAGLRGVWRSDNGGAAWVRINDNQHQWGLRFRAVSGDPRRYGRVYVATDGRGIVYGDPAELR